jgi:nucleoside-diphosphate-sugar epimerase
MIYITGANGWLGLNLIDSIHTGKTAKWGLERDQIKAFILSGTSKEKLLEISPNIKIVEGDISNKEDIEQFLSDSNDSYIFHTAGIIHPKRVSDFYRVNRDGTKNLLEAASKASVKRIVVVSSNSPCGCNPNDKHLFDENSPYNPYMNYGKSKMEMEQLANDFYKDGLVDLTIIRAPWFYGPYQPDRQKLFFEMIRTGKVPIVGSGNNLRSMGYTENLVQGMILAATKEISSGKTYWIADERPYTMNEIIDTIELLLTNDLSMECNYGRMKLPGFVSVIAEKIDALLQKFGLYHQKIHVLSEMNKHIACKIDLAKKELGYLPEYSLINGMRESLKEMYS